MQNFQRRADCIPHCLGKGRSACCASVERVPSLTLDAVQVLFNTQPVSFTRTCTTSAAADFQSDVTPPGVTVAAGAHLPGIVSLRLTTML